MINSFDRSTVCKIHAEALELLKPLAEKYGFKLDQAGGTFGATEYKMAFRLAITGEEALKADFARLCDFYGLKADHFGAIGIYKGRRVRLVGFEQSRPRFPIRATTSDGKTAIFTREALSSVWGIQRSIWGVQANK